MVPLDAEQPAALLYTSGTTGKPKGALISHRAMWHSAQAIAGCWRFSEDDVLLHALPLFHGHGLFVSSNVALASGARMIFLPKFVASAVIDCLPRSTVFMAVPTFYNRLLNEPGFSRQACARIRLLTSGSAPLPARTHQEIARRTGHQVVERYGATEAMVLCSNPVDGERRPGSVGKPLPGVEIRIADAHDAPLAAGAIGMVQARGPGLFSGYWRNAAQTAAEITADGFFRTGDLGWLSPDGYLTITGRQKDVVISGGYNVYPAEVEAALAEIEGVCEAAVVGVPHPDFGEAVVAFLVPHGRPGLPEGGAIVSALRTRLANYKLPKELYVLPELPRNVMGKVLKTSLRGLAAEGQAQRIH
jgi:malonyl-CoA/methylmalonyl-CoA synthetase